MLKSIRVLILFLLSSCLYAQDASCLIRDLEIASYWDSKLCEKLPPTFNHLFECGYFVTPSARMTESGDIGFGAAFAPPYLIYSGRAQPFSHLEISANYRIFRGVRDTHLSPHGFGDYADRGANAKLAFVLPENTFNDLPGLVIGVQDFFGSKKFTTYYTALTQVWINYGLETTIGWGTGLFTDGPSKGFFGGVNYFPFFPIGNKWFKGLALSAEFDPINYKRDPHPQAQKTRSHINFGLKYQLCNIFDFSLGYIKGKDVAASGSLRYNWGSTTGFLPKIKDPLPYTAPRDKEPLGCNRPEMVLVDQLAFALDAQGFRMTKAWLDGNTLGINIINRCYRKEVNVKSRVAHLLASLTPSNITCVVVTLETYGVPCQQYVFNQEILFDYANNLITPYEFELLTPREPPIFPHNEGRMIFENRLDLWNAKLSPRFETFLGSRKGKYKYDTGIRAELEGFLPWDIYYQLQVSTTIFSTAKDVSDFDLYNPSQLPNVLTDYVNYRHNNTFTYDKIYLQKNLNLGCSFFAKAALGYFQVNYAGVAAELLFYPPCSNFAIGIEGTALRKRSYAGLGFQNKLRQLQGYTPTYRSYFLLTQYFLSLYYDIPSWKVCGRASVGGFLAYDKGFLFSFTRYFDSGLRITGWITATNAHDRLNGKPNFFNKGIAVEVPFDMFFRCSSRRVWTHGMAEWLRDAGAQIPIGVPLFDTINLERRN